MHVVPVLVGDGEKLFVAFPHPFPAQRDGKELSGAFVNIVTFVNDEPVVRRDDDRFIKAFISCRPYIAVYEKQGMIRDDQTAVFRLLDRIIIKALAYMGTALLETGVLVAPYIFGK